MPLTHFLARARFEAEIFQHSRYCGSSAIDTAGSGKVPFHLIDKGSAWVHVVGNEPVLLQAGDLVLFPRERSSCRFERPHAAAQGPHQRPGPGAVRYGETFTSILCGFYVFDSAAAQALLDDLPDVVLLLGARTNPAAAGVGHIIDAALVEVEHDYPGRTAALCDLARLLLLHLRRRFADGSSSGYLAALGDPKISKALLLIHCRYGEDWTLESLAREIGMSRTSFAGRFHDLVGLPPAKYLTAWRMQEATTLLENTTLSVSSRSPSSAVIIRMSLSARLIRTLLG